VDSISDAVCTYAVEHRRRDVPPAAVAAAKLRVLDSLTCAVAAADSPPAIIARAVARHFSGTMSGSVIGLGATTAVDLAAFANTVMLRHLDCNDTYFTKRGGGGHPSDLIPTALAVGEAVGSSGYDVLRAVTLGYEVNGALASGVWLRQRGWDQGLNIEAAASMMAGDLLGLTVDQLRHALALAVTPHVPVRQTRVGHLSMWKGCATAGAVRNGVFAALLAFEGMTGPPEPYVGRSGIWDLVTGPFEITLPTHQDRRVVELTALKMRPAEFNAQAAIDLAIDLRTAVALDQIEQIEVSTYHLAVHEIGSDPAKWDPRNRETADHSLPYLLAVALVDGYVDSRSCAPERVLDASLRPLMNRIRVVEREEYTRRFPQAFEVEISVRLRDGATVTRHASYPVGHPRNPATEAQFDSKLRTLIQRLPEADRERWERMRECASTLDAAPDLSGLMSPVARLDIATDADRLASR
jgi:2-methylcitrate dehydratase